MSYAKLLKSLEDVMFNTKIEDINAGSAFVGMFKQLEDAKHKANLCTILGKLDSRLRDPQVNPFAAGTINMTTPFDVGAVIRTNDINK